MTSAAVRIDPRLRARRIEVRRAEGRRRLRLVLMLVVLVAAGAGAWGLTRSPLLDLDHVRVEGVSTETASAVADAAGAARGTALLDLDLGAIEASVAELPWVASVEATRQWPGTLHIAVTERVAIARLPVGDGTYYMVDADGVAMGVSAAVDAELPLIAVIADGELGGVQAIGLPGIAVVTAMPADLGPWVSSVLVDPSGAEVTVGLDLVGGALAELGDTDLLEDKLASLRAVLAGADLRCIEVIDIRVADLPTIMRDPVCDQAVTGAAAPASDGEAGG